MFDKVNDCYNVHIDYYPEAIRLCDDIQRNHRVVRLKKIPQLTWQLKNKSIPFQHNNIIEVHKMSLGKTKQEECGDIPNLRAFTLAYDIRPILNEYKEANIMFTGSSKIVLLKKK